MDTVDLTLAVPLWMYAVLGASVIATIFCSWRFVLRLMRNRRLLKEDMRRINVSHGPTFGWGLFALACGGGAALIGYFVFFASFRTISIDRSAVKMGYLWPGRTWEIPREEVASCTLEAESDRIRVLRITTTTARKFHSFYIPPARWSDAQKVVDAFRQAR